MSTNFPGSLDDFSPNPAPTSRRNNPSLAGKVTNLSDAVEAVEAAVGVTNSAVTSSLEYRVNNVRVPRVTTITSSATPTVNTDNTDAVTITALAAAITSMTSNLSGTPVNFQKLIYRIKDNGTPRAITWGASFLPMGVALPTTTVTSKVLTVGFLYDTVAGAWGCVASAQEA